MKNKKILFISLGCDKNLVDSEVMLGILADRGFEMTDTEDDADIIIINTCCFINDAKEESINTILEMAEYKKQRCRAELSCALQQSPSLYRKIRLSLFISLINTFSKSIVIALGV